MRRYFTYIDENVTGGVDALYAPPADDRAIKPGGSKAPHALYNIGNNNPEELGRLIDVIEAACGRKAVRDFQPMKPGDVAATAADIPAPTRESSFRPHVGMATNLKRVVECNRV